MAIFDLTLKGPIHQGEFVGINRESALEWVPSDTLFAAIVATWASQGQPVEAILEDFLNGMPPFLLTSAFPRAGTVRFYPAPSRLPARLFDAGHLAKSLKKIRWLSQGVLDELVKGGTPSAENSNFLHRGSIWLTPLDYQAVEPLLSEGEDHLLTLWRSQIVPHVTIDRNSNASNLFHTGRVTFGENCGLWFAVDRPTDAIRKALTHLSDAGLGGMRSTGHGAFEFKEDAQALQLATEAWGLCLSRYAPRTLNDITAGLQASESAYKLVTVGGWCQDDEGHSWRRRSVRLIAEGAILPTHVTGGLVDVRPMDVPQFKTRPVYRYAFPYLIPAGKLAEAL